jgi:Mg2+/Co2+ transporter CorB
MLYGLLFVLIVLSGFFSSSETSMMSLNRYRLRHLTKKDHHGAKRASALLERPDRLIGIILIGNNLVNIFATIVATIIAERLYGPAGVAAVGLILTFVILIFAEVTPKTIAALYPEKVAFPFSLVLKPLLTILSPFVTMVNFFSNNLIRMLGVDPEKTSDESLTPDELRTVVRESGHMVSPRFRNMLINILDLEGMTVEDIMVPRNEIVGLDLDKDMEELLDDICNSEFTRMPVYKEDINNIVGLLHMKKAARMMQKDILLMDKASITDNMRDPYFVPESTPLNIQLLNFQKERRRIGIVVDEYGDVQGLVTLEDLLEEIVGEFTTNLTPDSSEIKPQSDGSVIIDCSANIRDINRTLHWELSMEGPKTLNGLITEHLGNIPGNNIGFTIGDYCFETLELDDNRIKTVKAFEKNRTRPLFH